MAKQLSVYLDTSVLSAFFDGRDPRRQELTQEFWSRLADYQAVISPLVLAEIENTADPQRQREMLNLAAQLGRVDWTDEMERLTQCYITSGVFAATLISDARHVAARVVSSIPVLVSWSFRHLVNRSRRIRVNLINSQQGYNQIEIIAPPELG